MTEVAVALPAPEFAVTGVEVVPHAAAPTLNFAVTVTDSSGCEIYTIALTAQVQIDGDRRAYDPETRERLLDLFGEPERIPQTAGALCSSAASRRSYPVSPERASSRLPCR